MDRWGTTYGEGGRERTRENAAHLGPFVTETRREPAVRSMAAASAGSRKPGWSDSTSSCRVRRGNRTGDAPASAKMQVNGMPSK